MQQIAVFYILTIMLKPKINLLIAHMLENVKPSLLIINTHNVYYALMMDLVFQESLIVNNALFRIVIGAI